MNFLEIDDIANIFIFPINRSINKNAGGKGFLCLIDILLVLITLSSSRVVDNHFLGVTTSGFVLHCSLLLAVLLVLLLSDGVFVLLPVLSLFAPVLKIVLVFVDFLKKVMVRSACAFSYLVCCFFVEIFPMNEVFSINHAFYMNNISAYPHWFMFFFTPIK